jgi:simple sugar transport system permease protein
VRTGIGTETSLNVRGTKLIPESGMLHGTAFLDPGTKVYGFFFISIFIAIGYWFLLNRTRFGFDLRATGKSATAARTSGVESKRMAIVTMLLSGAIAGLVGLPYLLGETGSYNLNFPTDWGFTGIAIALLGRNNPLGIALGALLWAFLDISSGQLILEGVPREITTIMQGLIVIVVVMSYEIVRRNQVKSEQKNVAKALAKQEVAA